MRPEGRWAAEKVADAVFAGGEGAVFAAGEGAVFAAGEGAVLAAGEGATRGAHGAARGSRCRAGVFPSDLRLGVE